MTPVPHNNQLTAAAVQVWDLRSSSCSHSIERAHTSRVRGLAVLGFPGTVKMWKVWKGGPTFCSPRATNKRCPAFYNHFILLRPHLVFPVLIDLLPMHLVSSRHHLYHNCCLLIDGPSSGALHPAAYINPLGSDPLPSPPTHAYTHEP